MLTLTRSVGETIRIGDDIEIHVVEVRGALAPFAPQPADEPDPAAGGASPAPDGASGTPEGTRA